MKTTAALLLLLVLPLVAQEKPGPLKQAADLERKAEALLDQGKRAAAFELLARAADLREQARTGKKPAQVKPAPEPKEPGKAGPERVSGLAIRRLEDAIKIGDPMAIRREADQALKTFKSWQNDLRSREVALARRQRRLDERIAALETSVAELRRMIGAPK